MLTGLRREPNTKVNLESVIFRLYDLAVTDEKTIESLCNRIASGELDDLRSLIVPLSCARVYVPATSVKTTVESSVKSTGQSDRATGEISRVRVVTFPRKGQSSLVPAFSSRNKFNTWTQNRYEEVELLGSDLALALPSGCSIVINPGESAALTIDNEDVLLMASLEQNDKDFDHKPEFATASKPNEGVNDKPLVRTHVTPASNGVRVSRTISEPLVECRDMLEEVATGSESISESLSADADPHDTIGVEDRDLDLWNSVLRNVVAEIESVLLEYSEVEEAYFQEGGAGHAVLGLLTKGLDPDRRFLLIDQIAEISRMFFGAAGAVEVYDDLESTTSSSWELFNALTPFYSRQNLRDALTVEKQSKSEKDSTNQPAGIAASVKRRGAWLIGQIIGRNEES